jgi:hypothetical protein
MILVELDSVAIRWVMPETLLGATEEEDGGGGGGGEEEIITFLVTFLDTNVGEITCCQVLTGKNHSTEDTFYTVTQMRTSDSNYLFLGTHNNDLQTNNH